jgi:hypothetical protein
VLERAQGAEIPFPSAAPGRLEITKVRTRHGQRAQVRFGARELGRHERRGEERPLRRAIRQCQASNGIRIDLRQARQLQAENFRQLLGRTPNGEVVAHDAGEGRNGR